MAINHRRVWGREVAPTCAGRKKYETVEKQVQINLVIVRYNLFDLLDFGPLGQFALGMLWAERDKTEAAAGLAAGTGWPKGGTCTLLPVFTLDFSEASCLFCFILKLHPSPPFFFFFGVQYIQRLPAT